MAVLTLAVRIRATQNGVVEVLALPIELQVLLDGEFGDAVRAQGLGSMVFDDRNRLGPAVGDTPDELKTTLRTR